MFRKKKSRKQELQDEVINLERIAQIRQRLADEAPTKQEMATHLRMKNRALNGLASKKFQLEYLKEKR